MYFPVKHFCVIIKPVVSIVEFTVECVLLIVEGCSFNELNICLILQY